MARLQESKGVQDVIQAFADVRSKEGWTLEILGDGPYKPKLMMLAKTRPESQWTFVKGSIADQSAINGIFETYRPSIVVNLAAQAGVRYSITNPDTYIESNMIGFYRILEACRHSYDNFATGVEHLIYASSSSVYGTNKKVPYSTEDPVDNPVSL